MKYLCFVFTPYNYDDGPDGDGPSGGWFDFVGARNNIEAARWVVEDNWERGENYQIVDVFSLKVVEEGEVDQCGAITFEERDRREKVMKQAEALRYVGPRAPEPPRERFIKYGNYTFDRLFGRTTDEDETKQ